MFRPLQWHLRPENGWVNWLGLATLDAEVSEKLTDHLRRLLFDDPLDHTAHSAEAAQTR